MKLACIELYRLRMPLVHHFQTSFSKVNYQESIIIRLVSSGGAEGYGEIPASAWPYYCYETVRTAWYIINDFLIPIIRQNNPSDAKTLVSKFRQVRGHPMAKAGMEMAMLDLKASLEHKPLHEIYGGTRKFIPAGISLGIESKPDLLIRRINDSINKGYQRIKIKIQPGWDVNIVKSVRKHFPKLNLWVDANGAYNLKNIKILKTLDRFNLTMIEQPLSYDDIIEHSRLQAQLKTPLCLDESIKTLSDVRIAIKLKSCRVVNIKQARVGGPSNARALHDFLYGHNIPVWCGGLLETGVGRLHNIALASLPGFVLPADISESRRYYQEDIIDPPVVLEKKGLIKVPDSIGLGAQVIKSRLNKYVVNKLTKKL
ncbi:MAG: o-succinylbenzoate synthase [Candidatus Brocadiia bacterium]